MNKKIPCAVIGSTGIVGQHFVRMLLGHPFFEIVCLTASARTAGKAFAQAAEGRESGEDWPQVADLTVAPSTAEKIAASGARMVFVALPAAVAGDLELELRQRGLLVFSNASSHRMDEDVPLIIPEINPEHLALLEGQRARHPGFIVTNSNCTASGLVMALKPLLPFGLCSVTVTTFQAISGAGRRGVSGYDIMGNVIPFISQEEEKIGRECRKILGTFSAGRVTSPAFGINVACSRVPVKEGHLQSVTVALKQDISLDALREALSGFRGLPQALGLPTAPRQPLIVRDECDRPQPLLDAWAGGPGRARGMAVSVGRIRKQDGGVGFFLLVHNLVRGAAGSSILNAELAYRQGYIQ